GKVLIKRAVSNGGHSLYYNSSTHAVADPALATRAARNVRTTNGLVLPERRPACVEGPAELGDRAALADSNGIHRRARAAAAAAPPDSLVADESTVRDGEGSQIAINRASLGNADKSVGSRGNYAPIATDSPVAHKCAAADGGRGRALIENGAATDGPAFT